MKQVIVTFSKDGSVKREAVGFVGKECEKKTEWLDNLFGKGYRKHKESYYQEEEVKICDGLPSGHCG